MDIQNPDEILSMSDDEIMNMVSPPVIQEEEEDSTSQNQNQDPVIDEDENNLEEGRQQEEENEDENRDNGEGDGQQHQEEDPDGASNPESHGSEAEGKTAAQNSGGTVDYEAAYKRIMAPFKANGKTIELHSVDEAIQLMQMGANYTRKMQAIQPHRKLLVMLENNGLLDAGKLSYLIDLDKKNPDAIKKLVKDAGIDPLEISPDEETSYKQGNHAVTDAEVAFRSTLDELNSSSEGQSTIQFINSQWDQASKEALWTNPEIMQVIHDQRQSGIYDRIAKEVERRRNLGAIPFDMPFIYAYRQVGDQLHASGAFNDLAPQPSGKAVQRVAHPKARVANGSKAAAAGTPRNGNKPNKAFVNPLSMSDEEFLKMMENRV